MSATDPRSLFPYDEASKRRDKAEQGVMIIKASTMLLDKITENRIDKTVCKQAWELIRLAIGLLYHYPQAAVIRAFWEVQEHARKLK